MGATTETRIIELCRRWRSSITREALLAGGISRGAIERRVAAGFLEARYDGVYVVNGPRQDPLADESAALLACRPDALLTARTAGRLMNLPVRHESRIEIVVVGRHRAHLRGVRVGSVGRLEPAEICRHHSLPIVSPAFALLEIAARGVRDEFVACLHEARVLGLTTDEQLRATIAAHPNRRGARLLARQLDREGGVRVTRTNAERTTLKLMRAHGLQPDHSEYEIGPYTLDFFFEAERVAVEFDSRRYHDNPRRFVSDRRRMAYLAGKGILTFPLTDDDLGPGAKRAMVNLEATLESRRAA